MADNKKIFKGFKQVTYDSFERLTNEEKQGYLWFVRTPIFEGDETEETNNVVNDSYDIYFGSKQYGHFCEGEINAIKERIEGLEESVDGLVDSLDDLITLVSGNTTSISANTQSIQSINERLGNEFLLKNIDSNDKVLTVADGILSSAISLEYTDGYIKLIGKDSNVISSFDASDFVKDSFLEDVEVIDGEDGEKYIKFTWNTIDNETKTDTIKVTDFAKFYSAGTALELTTDDTFNVKVAANDNFLTVNNNNELIITGVTTNKTTVNQAITIEGGPLATDAVKNAFTDGVIPAGTDIQEILKALLCQEIYPTPTANTPTYSIKIKNTPSVTSSSSINNGDLVELGQQITFNSVTAVTVTASTITNPKVSKFDYGYATDLTGETINSATAVTASWDINQSDDTFYKLSAEIVSGFTDGSVPTEVTAATNDDCVLSGCTLTAVLGKNTYKVTEEAPEYTGTHSGVTSYYVVSNLSGRSDEHKSPSIPANTGLTQTATASATTFTVTGVYPCYSNIKNNVFTDNATEKLNLITGSTFTFESVPTEFNSTYSFMFDYPTTHSISSFLTEDLQGNWVPFSAYYNDKSETIEKTIQGKKYDYYRLTTGGTNGPGKYKITLNKNLYQ